MESGSTERLVISATDLQSLKMIEAKVLWLSSWIIHEANHIRPARDGLKVGGHQASCASVITLMTALYFWALRPEDRVAVKPHASPVFHAIQYLMGRQTKEKLEKFRGFGGAQSYPSRTKGIDDVDISTGSVGLGGALTLFASLAQDYVRAHDLSDSQKLDGRMVALFGDAELDEGNVFEALFEGRKHNIQNLWWIIDYNRQSLDSVVTDKVFNRLRELFQSMDWNVETIKYGKLLQEAAEQPGGNALLSWIDDCPNQLYSALTFKGGEAWRQRLKDDIGDSSGIAGLMDSYDDEGLQSLMTNLAGHDMESVLEAYKKAADSDAPTCIIAYTIKGYGLPMAGHKDNHAGLMSLEQMEEFKTQCRIAKGEEWGHFSGFPDEEEKLAEFIKAAPFYSKAPRQYWPAAVEVPPRLGFRKSKITSTQESFGRILNEIGRESGEFAKRLVSTSPDVTVSTNLGPWVNRKQIFDRRQRPDVFRLEEVVSSQSWTMSPNGQHIELGIAENNLFLMLAALGLSAEWFGARLLPIGTLYDPFIARGLDALNYACYQDARFMLVGTPSGISLAPEGGAHQSIGTPLIGIGQPGLIYFEPTYADELAVIMQWGFHYMQADDGGSVYLRLSTRPLPQLERDLNDDLVKGIISGGYWRVKPSVNTSLVLVYCGVIAPEVEKAFEEILGDEPETAVLAITSPDRLYVNWQKAKGLELDRLDFDQSIIEAILSSVPRTATLVTVIDGHPATLSWLGSVLGHRVHPLGVSAFGQSGDIPDLYNCYGLDSDKIINAVAKVCLQSIDR